MKSLLFILALFAVAFTQDPELEACIKKNCPDQYNKCLATSGCKEKLEKCEAKCGAKIAASCWTLCLGTPGAAANVATCAVNQGCLKNQIFDYLNDIVAEFSQ